VRSVRLHLLRKRMQPDCWLDSLTGRGGQPMSNALEDEAAVDRVLQGDPDAFAAIVRRWQGPLVNLAYRFCGDRGRAEEMAQEAFVRAFRALHTWPRDAAFAI